MKVAVVGGGVVGLTTARQLQEQLRNIEKLDIFASSFEDTVSHVAAGIFRVGASYSASTDELTQKWVKDSFDYYNDVRVSNEGSSAGITSISGYIFGNTEATVKNQWMESIVPLYRRATEEEFELVGGSWKYGSFLTTILTECSLYLPWMRRRLESSGAKTAQRSIGNLRELAGSYDFVLNCTGLGARELCNDRHMVPLRGQVLKVKAPWLKTFFYGDLDTYIIPGFGGKVTLGGSRNYDAQNMTICKHESAAIRERCEKLLPSLKKAELIEEKVGLRPHREGRVRVELEGISGSSKTIVIHNYGHGGYGVCTAPGTAKHAVNLLLNAHKSTQARL